MRPVLLTILVGGGILVGVFSSAGAQGGGGERSEEYYPSNWCSDAQCRAPPKSLRCRPFYDKRDDGCCPEWKCGNGQSFYGVRRLLPSSEVNNWRRNSDWKWPWFGGNKNSLFDRNEDFFGNPGRSKPGNRI